MIETLYSLDALQTPVAFVLALLLGVAFGTALEQAGFGSSRRLSAVFYFRDMTVVKVMFTAVITAMLGLSYCFAFGFLKADGLHLLESIYGAQIVGGLVFGIGFVMGGWCPGTAAVGLASGRLDALIFLVGAMLGSLVFNELYPLLTSLVNMGNRGVVMIYDVLGVTRPVFALGFSGVAIATFWGSELIEEHRGTGNLGRRLGSLILVTIGFLLAAGGLFLPIPTLAKGASGGASWPTGHDGPPGPTPARYQGIMETIDQAGDHIEPEELADRLMRKEAGLTVVDVRPPEEFHRFHLRGSVNIPLAALLESLSPIRNQGMIVLCSTGMTHSAQARDLLALQGFPQVYFLTDGINGFVTRCLKPSSLRGEPIDPEYARRIDTWRNHFLADAEPTP